MPSVHVVVRRFKRVKVHNKMRTKLVSLVLLTFLITGCSLADDVTPPPALATAQAAPLQQATAPVDSAPEAIPAEPVGFSPPETPPSLFSGASIYAQSCEPCHGPSGLGDGSMAGNLQVPPPPLGDFEVARKARPIDWYGLATEGRMDRFMPPFGSLSDAQRWDVVAYALSLSHPLETRQRGAELYAETCAGCHGEQGGGAENGPPLNTGQMFANRSIDALLTTIQEGKGNMPAFIETLQEDDLLLLAAYVQSLGTVVHGDSAAEVELSSGAVDPGAVVSGGMIRGVVSNGTADARLPEGLVVTLVGLEGNVPVFEEDVPVNTTGSFSMEGIEIQPGRIYGALVEYQGVIYFSVGGHLLEESPTLDLPLVVYETTPDESKVKVDRLHLIFDFSVEGLVEVSELWLLSSDGDRTVVPHEGANALPIQLPEGFSNLRFGSALTLEQFSLTEDGFLIHEPIRPGEPLEVVFSFTLPYERSMQFTQSMNLPVQAVVLLAASEAPEIEGEGVEDLGERDMGGLILRSYAMSGLEAGDHLELSLRGKHPLAGSGLSSSTLVLGLAVFGVVLIVVAAVLWGWQRRGAERLEDASLKESPTLGRGQLLKDIASLDDAYEAGEMDQSDYEQQRAALKAQLLENMQSDD
jgi:mono/diheme cytochrome c family protein